MSNLASQLGQIGPEWDKSESSGSQNLLKYLKKYQNCAFWGANLIHFGAKSERTEYSESKCTESDLKSLRFVPFGANLTQFGCQILHSCLELMRLTRMS